MSERSNVLVVHDPMPAGATSRFAARCAALSAARNALKDTMAWVELSLTVRTVRMIAMLNTAASVMSAIADTSPMPCTFRRSTRNRRSGELGCISHMSQMVESNGLATRADLDVHGDDAVGQQRGRCH